MELYNINVYVVLLALYLCPFPRLPKQKTIERTFAEPFPYTDVFHEDTKQDLGGVKEKGVIRDGWHRL